MATITTTTNATPLVWPSTSLIERHPKTGHLYAMVKASVANTFELWRSTNNGGTWSLLMSQVRANVQEISSLLIPTDGLVYWAFRTHESGQDRVYTQRMAVGNTLQWGTQVLIASATAASAGAVYQGLDIASATKSSGSIRMVAVAVGTTIGAQHGVTMVGETIDSNSNPTATNSIFGGTRQWLITGSGRITPSLEIEHTGDHHSGSPAHLWVTWGRSDFFVAKMAWNGSQWVGPTTPVKLTPAPLAVAQDYTAGRWDGQRFLVVAPDPTTTDVVRVYERNRANTATTSRLTPAHPAGVIRTCSLGYNSVNGDFRVYAVGTANPDLYFVDFIRATGAWTSWATVSTSDVLGTPPNNYSIRRATFGNAKYDVLYAFGPSPNTITHLAQPLTYAPNPPSWDTTTIGYNNGAAADVNAALNLAWLFSDPDTNDTQSAWALSRQIGAGTVQYLRASDSTWQATEQKNVGATTSRTLAAGWGLDADAPHSYAVKVWDSADLASQYSQAFVVVPSVKVNPTITAPTAGGVISTDQVTATWTVAQQTAYRVTLAMNPGGFVVHDSGWRTSTDTSYTVPTRLGDGSGWTLTVQTRNSEGLASNVVTVTFTVDYLEPPAPTLVATPQPANGVISVAITNPAPSGGQPAVVDQDLWRRPVGDTSEGVRVGEGLLGGVTYGDWRAVSGVNYEYRVLARGLNGTSIFGPWTA